MKWNLIVIVAAALAASATPSFATTCGMTSYYGTESGNRTANGERFNPNGMTAAHRTLKFGTRINVCPNDYRQHGPCVIVRINDRGPAKRTGRDLDLSIGAAREIGIIKAGVVRTCWEIEK